MEIVGIVFREDFQNRSRPTIVEVGRRPPDLAQRGDVELFPLMAPARPNVPRFHDGVVFPLVAGCAPRLAKDVPAARERLVVGRARRRNRPEGFKVGHDGFRIASGRDGEKEGESEMAGPSTYYKLVALTDPAWLKSEFLEGRARFGWSGEGTDLRVLSERPSSERTENQRVAWRYTQFLFSRIKVGDRVVYQFDQPLREFLIGEVVSPEYSWDTARLEDFNHILHVRPMVERPIAVTSKVVPGFLRHDLSKRGQYYRIYSETSSSALDELTSGPLPEGKREDADDLAETSAALSRSVVKEIHQRWPAKAFERFVGWLFHQVPGVEVRDIQDTHQGWDLRVRIRDPLSGEPLYDDVPVQCKNFTGPVDDERPITDLTRSVRESRSGLAYLVILGEVDDSYRRRVAAAEEDLSREMDMQVKLIVVDEARVAQLYVQAISGDSTLEA